MNKLSQPNILWIGMDELQRQALGLYGGYDGQCKTSNIDKLASESLVFDQAFCPTAVCAPSRASMLMGKMPSEGSIISNDGMEWTVPYRHVGKEEKALPTWALDLKVAGYKCVHVGKFHVTPGGTPSEQGFEGPDWAGYGGIWDLPDFYKYRKKLGLTPKPELEEELPSKHPIPYCFSPVCAKLKGSDEGSLPAFVAYKTNEYLKQLAKRVRSESKPFFLRCEFWGPHIPCWIAEPYYSMYDPKSLKLPENFGVLGENKPEIQSNFSGGMGIASHDETHQRLLISKYLGYVTCIDNQIGLILKVLNDLELTEETIVVFTADHGDMLGAHGLYDKGPFMYEEIYRIPLMVKWPGVVAPGRNDAFVYNMDMGATMWELAGKRVPNGASAKSLLPVLKGIFEDLGRKMIISEFYRQWDFYPQVMVRSRTEKFIYNFGGIDEFYDLVNDPYELKNCIKDLEVQFKVRTMRNFLHDWLRKTNSPMLHGFERTLGPKSNR